MKRLDDFLHPPAQTEEPVADFKRGGSENHGTFRANTGKSEGKTRDVRFRFAHMADCHLGAFREEYLRELNLKAFELAIDACISREVDFIVISGDLFHRSFPDLRVMKRAVEKMKEAVNMGIRFYLIYGSHDYTANSTSLIDILGSAGLFKKVFVVDSDANLRPVIDEETGVELMGISGRTQALEKEYYKVIKAVPGEGFTIFMFHTAISELRPSYVPEEDAIPESMLPKGFDYYAGGHVHERIEHERIFFPGPLFGAEFRDLSALAERGFYVVDVDDRGVRPEFVPIRVADFELLNVDFTGMDSKEASELLLQRCHRSVEGKVVLLSLHGTLKKGSVTDLDIHGAKRDLMKGGAEFVAMTRNVTSTDRPVVIVAGSTREEIEEKLFNELFGEDHTKARNLFSELSLAREERGIGTDDFARELEQIGMRFFGLEIEERGE